MSIILKTQPANSIPNPPAGKGTIFLTDAGALQVKQPDGNISSFPTLSPTNNTAVLFNDDGSLGTNNTFTFNKTSNTLSVANLSVTGTLNAGDISVSSIANGTSNVDIIGVSGNVTISVNGNANILTVTDTGANISGTLNVTANANVGNIGATNGVFTNVSGNGSSLSSITGSNVTGAVAYATTANSVAGANVSGEVSYAATANSVAGANVSGQVGNAAIAGTVYSSSQPNITSVGTLTSLAVTGDITSGNVYANSGTIGANLLTGTLTTSSQPNITSVGTLSSLNVTGNIAGGNLNTAGKVVASTLESNVATGTAPFTVASTTKVTNLNADLLDGYSSDTSNTANTVAVRDTNGNLSATYFIGNGSQLTGIDATSIQNGNSNVKVAANGNVTISVTGNANIVTITDTGANVTGYLTVTGNITSANANLGNLATANYISGTLTTAAQPNVTSVGTLSSLSVTGNANVGNIGAGIGVFTANISGNNLSTTNKITAGNGLQVTTGAIDVLAGNLNVTGNINVTGNLNYSNVTDLVVGDPLIYIGANNTGDTVDLGIVASYNNGTYYHTGLARNAATDYWTFFDGVVAEPTTVIDWANATYPTVKLGNLIATGTANITGNANVGNIGAAAGVFTGTISVTGNANVGNLGTAQVLATANITTPQLISNVATGTAPFVVTSTTQVANLSVATAGSATTAGTVTTAAQPNITSVGTLTGLTSNGTINFTGASNVSLGAVGNVKITGGSNGQYLQTNGSGTLSWSTVQGATITDDTSTNSTYYPVYATASSGSFTTAGITTTKLQFNPSTGQLTVQDLNTLSDITLKENVNDIQDPLTILEKLNGVEFNWVDNKRKSYGLIAQLVEKVIPELVSENEQGKKTVNYISIIAFLIEAVKKQQTDIDLLKRTINTVSRVQGDDDGN
jgi:hypothetical protein